MLGSGTPRYEVASRTVATKAGGLGVIHALVRSLGLDRLINKMVPVFLLHLPYFESDHILSIAYSFLAGGRSLEHIEKLRQDEGYLNMLGASRIPDPTTAGDFLRRFTTSAQIENLMEAVNAVRLRVWSWRRRMLGEEAIIEVDGTFTPTYGEKKEGIGYSYKGAWGYHPLVVSLANTQEPLYIENRPGQVPSNSNAAYWVNKAIGLTRQVFGRVLLRGDTDFSMTKHLDEWDRQQVQFVLGFDAKKGLVQQANELPQSAWRRLVRRERGRPGRPRRKLRDNVKEQIVQEKEYKNIRLRSEDVAEFPYRPAACKKWYRMVVVRKNLTIERGERALFDDIRYFFYITNLTEPEREEIVFTANDRANQENLIEQLKNGVRALHNPAHTLHSNWAYMVIASLAWSLKAWFALSLQRVADRRHILALEFRGFLDSLMLIPAQVLVTGRRLVIRLLAYTEEARLLFSCLTAQPQMAAIPEVAATATSPP